MHFRTTKLLYDLLNEYFKLDSEMARGEQSKLDAASTIKQCLKDTLKEYGSDEPVHIPHGELYLSLRQLRQLLHRERMERRSEDE